MSPIVSVVIPAYNEEKYIKDCIESVQKQKTNFPFEVIVVNNNCTDDTVEIVKKIENVILVDEHQKGLAFARQKGLDTAKGELLVYLDADVRLTPHWLQEIKEFFDTHPGVSGVSTGFAFYDGKLSHKLGSYIFLFLLVPLATIFLRLLGKPDVLLGQSNAMRTAALRKAGGINLDFVFHGEDTSLAYQLHKEGEVRFLHHPIVKSSARRYIRDGSFRTIYDYWMTYALFTLGGYRSAKEFAHRHNPK
jgi:glycosyltransferase involved in cell wall biosynthesis